MRKISLICIMNFNFFMLLGQTSSSSKIIQYALDTINGHFSETHTTHDTLIIIRNNIEKIKLRSKQKQKLLIYSVQEFKLKFNLENKPSGCQIYIPDINFEKEHSIRIKFFSDQENIDGSLIINFKKKGNKIDIIDHHFYIWHTGDDIQ